MSLVNWVILILAVITSVGLLLSQDWRWILGLLAVQYFVVFWMVQTNWPVTMAASKLVTGWMACAVIGIAQINARPEEETINNWRQGQLFHIFAAAMILAATFAISLQATAWLHISLPIAWGGLLLFGLGLLQLGISSNPFRVVIGLLTVMAGFEILYATVERAALVTALLVVVDLGLALTGAFFLNITKEKVP